MDMQREAELTNIAYALIESQPASMHGLVSKIVDTDNAAFLGVMASMMATRFPEYNLTLPEGFLILEILLKDEHINEPDFPDACRSIWDCTSPLGACRCIPNEEMNV